MIFETGQPIRAKHHFGTWSWPDILAALVAYSALSAAALFMISRFSGVSEADLSSNGDQAAHYVNGLLIHDYLLQALGQNPMRFALDYYEHFPRVSIGHWPPVFHIIEALWMLLAGRSEPAALLLQLLIAAALCGAAATVVAARHGLIAGTAAAFIVLACPDLLRLVGTVMLDNVLALMVLAASLAWARYARTQDWRWSAGFGLVATAAILTKANALGLGLLPPFYCLLSARWRLLLSWKTWLAALIVLPPTVLWYALTYRITADGFNYQPGLAYTSMAIPAFAGLLAGLVGPVVLVGFVIGVTVLVRQARRNSIDEQGLALAAVVMALFCFSVIAPADVQSRYLLPVVAPALIVAWLGLEHVLRRWISEPPGIVLASIPPALLLLGAASIFHMPHVATLRMNLAAANVLSAASNGPLVMVAASPNGEGAAIAAFAATGDPDYYVIRGTKALASGNFMGTDYSLRFETEQDVARWVTDNHIGWIILEDSTASLAFQHNGQVQHMLDQPGSLWQRVGLHAFPGGETRVYRLPIVPPSPAEISATMRELAPTKLIGGVSQ